MQVADVETQDGKLSSSGSRSYLVRQTSAFGRGTHRDDRNQSGANRAATAVDERRERGAEHEKSLSRNVASGNDTKTAKLRRKCFPLFACDKLSSRRSAVAPSDEVKHGSSANSSTTAKTRTVGSGRNRARIFVAPIVDIEVLGKKESSMTLLGRIAGERISKRIVRCIYHKFFVIGLVLCYVILTLQALYFHLTGYLPSDDLLPAGAWRFLVFALLFVLPFCTFVVSHIAFLNYALVKRVLFVPYAYICIIEVTLFCISYSGTFCWSKASLWIGISLWAVGMTAIFFDAVSARLRLRLRWLFVAYSVVLAMICLSLFLRNTPGLCIIGYYEVRSTEEQETCSSTSSSTGVSFLKPINDDVMISLFRHFGLEMIDVALGRASSLVFLFARLLFTAFRRDIKECYLIFCPVETRYGPKTEENNMTDHKIELNKSLLTPVLVSSKGSRKKDVPTSDAAGAASSVSEEGKGKGKSDLSKAVELHTLTTDERLKTFYPLAEDVRDASANEGAHCNCTASHPLPSPAPVCLSDRPTMAKQLKLVPKWSSIELNTDIDGKIIVHILGRRVGRRYLRIRKRCGPLVGTISLLSTAFYTSMVIPFILGGPQARGVLWRCSMVSCAVLCEIVMSVYSMDLIKMTLQRVDFWFACMKCCLLVTGLSGAFCLRSSYSAFWAGLGFGTVVGTFMMDALPLSVQRFSRFFSIPVLASIVLSMYAVLNLKVEDMDCMDIRVSLFGGSLWKAEEIVLSQPSSAAPTMNLTVSSACTGTKPLGQTVSLAVQREFVRFGYNNATMMDVIRSRTFSWKEMVLTNGFTMAFLSALQLFTAIWFRRRLAIIESPMILIEERNKQICTSNSPQPNLS